jgi:CMP-N-acetylneuraminic acid synthetase
MYVEEAGLLKPLLGEKDVVMRRQDFPSVYVRNGAIYIAERDLVMEDRRIRDDRSRLYLMPRERSINIDESRDLEEVAHILNLTSKKQG